MTKPLDNNFNYDLPTTSASPITTGGAVFGTPKQVRGGIYSPADVPLIKEALSAYAQTLPEGDVKGNQIANLLHRLNSRT